MGFHKLFGAKFKGFCSILLKNPEMYRILLNFGVRANFATTPNDSPASFFDSVKSSWKYIIWIFRITQNLKKIFFWPRPPPIPLKRCPKSKKRSVSYSFFVLYSPVSFGNQWSFHFCKIIIFHHIRTSSFWKSVSYEEECIFSIC